MECSEIREMLVEYIDGDLADGVRNRVAEHLDGCYLCMEELDNLKNELRMCESAVRHPMPVDKFAELSGRLFSPSRHVAYRHRVHAADVFRRLAIAAMVIFAVVVSPLVLDTAGWLLTPVQKNAYVHLGLAAARPVVAWRHKIHIFKVELGLNGSVADLDL